MSASSSSTSERLGSAEALEEAYVHLTTRLLLQLQQRDILGALQTAESVRKVCLDGASQSCSTSAASPAGTPTPGQTLFYGSPAELLLRSMYNDGALSTEAVDLSPRSPSAAPADDSASSETEEASSQTSTTSNDSDTSTSSSSASGKRSGVDPSERRQQQQQQQQQQFESLATALTKWSRMPASPARKKIKQPAAAAAASSKASLRPTPPPPKVRAQRRPAPKEINTSQRPEGNDSEDVHHERVLASTAVNSDAEAEAAWQRMQQQVAHEMERLAVVRKHR